MILTILQARMSSSRLPGKVMRPMAGVPMIGRQIERLRRCETLGKLVLATSLEPSDDPLAAYVERLGVTVFRGSLNDVLGRFQAAVTAHGPAEHVVRLTGDCPLADPDVIDACVRLHLNAGRDYTSNTLDRTFPVGLDVEVMRASALAEAFRDAADPYDREHVTPYLYRNPTRFSLMQLRQNPDLSGLRWTVDYPEDFAFAEQVFEALIEPFGQSQILKLPFGRRMAA
ncbi:glycosyltransferase family protein [Brevundimonas sp. 2R-24]|uniref:Glycosyltransferase family protein n=1 Tax=Peiella sedimenti TaxID=3061083 RepID=A0ABT8SH94_9CAUL|nr:glycosyltransferase family protein [Caulobacteraceae bacterium XZ-24]